MKTLHKPDSFCLYILILIGKIVRKTKGTSQYKINNENALFDHFFISLVSLTILKLALGEREKFYKGNFLFLYNSAKDECMNT